MPLIQKARTGVGWVVQIIGGILWIGCGILMLIWALYVLFTLFGWWTILVGLLVFPITYIASIFIIWFGTGSFPLILLAPYIASLSGMLLVGLGGSIKGEE